MLIIRIAKALREAIFNVNLTNAKSGKNRLAILTTFSHLCRASRGANGDIEFTLI